MTAYCDSDVQYFTRVPHVVYDALEDGDITLLQFLILCFWHKKANRQTGVVRSFRAEMILDWLAETDCSAFNGYLPSLKIVRRHVRGIWEAGWCRSGYRQGSKKPYDVTLYNFSPAKMIKNDDLRRTPENGAGEDVGVGCEESILHPSNTVPWKETPLFRGSDENRFAERDEHAKHQNTAACGGGQENLPFPKNTLITPSSRTARELMKDLPKVASKVLHNTRAVPKNLAFNFELLVIAYGAGKIRNDFEVWCNEHHDDDFPYPVREYLKVIDSRLGGAPVEPQPNFKDSHVAELASLSYEQTGLIPAKKSVASVLLSYPFDEIKGALLEYAETLTEKEMKSRMRAFWSEGGAGAVIMARRHRSGNSQQVSCSTK
jgi:hypothetical protein